MTIAEPISIAAGLDQGLLKQGTGSTDEEKLMNASIDPAAADVGAYDRERKLLEQYEKDLASAKMKNLKKDAIKAYDDWREGVLRRVGEVVNSQETVKKQLQKESRSDTARPRAPQTSGRVTKGSPPYGNIKFRDLFPPTKTPLTKIDMEKRTLVLHSILLLLISLEHYTAPSRILLLNLTSSFKLPLRTFEQDEYTTAKGLLEAAKEMTADEETKKRAKENQDSRKRKVQLASIAGAAIIGVTGGLAAPMIAAGVGSVMGGLGLGATAAAGYLGSVAGSTVLVGGLFGAYGGRMTGQMMDNYAREVEDFAFLPVHSRNRTSENEKEGAEQASEHDHKLRVTICISGWLTEKEEVVKPWKVMGQGAEVFALKYELEALLNLGNAMNGMVQSAAWGYAQKQLIAQTIFADLASALWPIGLLKAARVIDNPFSVAKGRADKAGEVLADALINKAQGERPVTLIGYSMGARVIYSCLKSLAARKAFGLVESVVMMGSPTPSDTSDWRIMRSVVSGRLVNVYSENDYILGFMYRTSSIQYGVAGLQKVEGLAGVENVNVSEDVPGHLRYRFLVGSILKKIGFEDVDMDAVEKEREALQKMEEEEKKQSLQAQRKRLLRRQSTGGKEDEAAEAEAEAGDLEEQVKAQTQKSLTTRAIEWFYTPSVPSAKDYEKIAGNLQRAANDPTDAANAARDTVNDVQASTQSYAQWAADKLPSMSYMGGSKRASTKAVPDPTKTTTDATNKLPTSVSDAKKTATDATASTQSYTQYAASYLPSLPSVTGRGKSAAAPTDAGKKATDTSKAAADTASKQATNVGKQGSEAANTATNAVKQAPIIHQATEKAPDVSEAVSGVTEKATDPIKTIGEAAGQKKPASGSYTSYLPGLPSLPTFGRSAAQEPDTKEKSGLTDGKPEINRTTSDAKKQIPKLDRKPSGVTSVAPKLDRTPSGVESPPPKLDRMPSGVKSPAPKLDRVPSGIKSPPPKLDRLPSGVKSPPPKLDRLPSGMKSPPPKLDRLPSGVKSPPPKLDRLPSGVKSPAQGLQRTVSGMKSPAATAGKAMESAPGLKQGRNAVSNGATKAKETVPGLKQGSDAITGAARKGSDAASSGNKSGYYDAVTGAASSGASAVGGGLKQGSDTVTEAASSGAAAVGSGMKQGGDAATGAATKSKDVAAAGVKQSSDAATGVASKGSEAVGAGLKQGADMLNKARPYTPKVPGLWN